MFASVFKITICIWMYCMHCMLTNYTYKYDDVCLYDHDMYVITYVTYVENMYLSSQHYENS